LIEVILIKFMFLRAPQLLKKHLKARKKHLIKVLLCCGLISLFAPHAFGAQPSSDNYKLNNINFGQQMFLTTTDFSPTMILGTGPEVVELTPFSAKIRWNTDKKSNSSIFYGVQTETYEFESSKAYDFTAAHEIELTNLTPKTEYFFMAKSRDANGNMGESEEKKFVTPLPIPEINNLKIQDVTENSARLVFSTNYYATSVVEYINVTSLEKNTAAETGFSRDHSIPIQNLTSDQNYSCTIIARDEEGHESRSSSISFSTLRDTKPPKIDNVKFDINVIAGKNKVRATIAWKTDEDSASQVKFKESNVEQYSESAELPDLVENHFVTLPDLKPQTTYKMISVSKDKTGNVGQSEEYILLTPKQKRTFLQIILENIQQIFEPFSKLFNE